MERRELLFELALVLGGVPTVALLRRLGPDSADRMAVAIRTPGHVDGAAVAAFETLTDQCRRMEDAWGPRKLVGTVDAQRDTVASLLDRESLTPALRSRLVHVYAQLCQLGGYLHYDLMDYPAAEQRFRLGLEAALDIGDATLVAYIHYGLSEMASFADRPAKALDHAFAARGWAERSGSSLVRERAAFGMAWALAANGQKTESLRALEALHLWPDRLTSSEPSYLYWIKESHASEGAACTVLNELGRFDETICTVTRQLAACGADYGGERAFGLLKYGQALVIQREIPAATTKLAEAADIMRRHSSARLVHQLGQVRRRLEPWATNTYVRNLDDRLRTYGLVPA